jgi:hypothetical protein
MLADYPNLGALAPAPVEVAPDAMEEAPASMEMETSSLNQGEMGGEAN